MFILDRRTFLQTTAAGLATGLAQPAHAAIQPAEVFTAPPDAALVDSVIVMGDEKAVLIDAQMLAPAASAVADRIAASGRTLETIFLTHHHPDHVLGLAVLMDRFPDAKTVTHAKIQPIIAQSAQVMLESFKANAPAGVFADRAIVPEAMTGDHILLEGERLEILEPMHGDTDYISAVHIPALDTLVASDFAYADTHAWVAENQTPEAINAWRASLDQLEAIGASTVIPGHRSETSANDASVFSKTRAYLDLWDRVKAEAKSAEEMKAMLMAGREDWGLAMAVDRAIAGAFPG